MNGSSLTVTSVKVEKSECRRTARARVEKERRLKLRHCRLAPAELVCLDHGGHTPTLYIHAVLFLQDLSLEGEEKYMPVSMGVRSGAKVSDFRGTSGAAAGMTVDAVSTSSRVRDRVPCPTCDWSL
jgi:hypothetical protein